jgi:Ni/Co efflux regulator RcnB
MTGTNGLAPIEQLNERQKCPDAPTKRKYRNQDAAWKAAHEATEKNGVLIAPYACPGCGAYHLTRKVDGSDVLTRQDGPIVLTGAQRRKMAKHPAAAPVPARVTLPEPETPLVAGNRDARRKMLLGWLADNPTPATHEVRAFLNVTGPTVRTDMLAVGWTQERRGHWTRGTTEPEFERQEEPDTREWRDIALDSVPDGLDFHACMALWEAAGLLVRVQVS